jgi:Flp pilus assembly protein TadG
MAGTMRDRLLALVKRPLAFIAARRFVREQSGAAAVEFAMVAAPFLGMIFAIMETAMVFFAGQVLETAASGGARLIMTGQAQTQGFDQAKFKETVCAKIYALFDCNGKFYVDVKSYPTFAVVNVAKPGIDGSGNLQTGDFGYKPGCPGDIVVVRMMYQWPVYVSLLGVNLSDTGASNRLLMATVAFRNEPYGSPC